jgi:hypothetical protein
MENTARIESLAPDASNNSDECEVIELRPNYGEHDSLFGNFVDEIDAWARQALAANGLGDYGAQMGSPSAGCPLLPIPARRRRLMAPGSAYAGYRNPGDRVTPIVNMRRQISDTMRATVNVNMVFVAVIHTR